MTSCCWLWVIFGNPCWSNLGRAGCFIYCSRPWTAGKSGARDLHAILEQFAVSAGANMYWWQKVILRNLGETVFLGPGNWKKCLQRPSKSGGDPTPTNRQAGYWLIVFNRSPFDLWKVGSSQFSDAYKNFIPLHLEEYF